MPHLVASMICFSPSFFSTYYLNYQKPIWVFSHFIQYLQSLLESRLKILYFFFFFVFLGVIVCAGTSWRDLYNGETWCCATWTRKLKTTLVLTIFLNHSVKWCLRFRNIFSYRSICLIFNKISFILSYTSPSHNKIDISINNLFSLIKKIQKWNLTLKLKVHKFLHCAQNPTLCWYTQTIQDLIYFLQSTHILKGLRASHVTEGNIAHYLPWVVRNQH